LDDKEKVIEILYSNEYKLGAGYNIHGY